MQVVIEIPEEDYIRLRDEGMFGNVTTFKRAVREGVPLAEQEPCEDSIVEWKKDFKEYVNSLSMPRDDYNGIMEYIDELPVTPQYTDAEIQKMQDLEFAEIQKAYEIGKDEGSEVLDKIRAEIAERMRNSGGEPNRDIAFNVCLKIIDKYKASPTGAERSDKE